jgi:hypothetical protein
MSTETSVYPYYRYLYVIVNNNASQLRQQSRGAGRTGTEAESSPASSRLPVAVRRRASATGIATKIGNHTFRATGITAYLKKGGRLENAAARVNRASTRTPAVRPATLEISLDGVERIRL